MAQVIHDSEGEHIELEATEARQANKGVPVLLVLLASTVLAAVVLFASWGFKFGDLAQSDREKSTTTPAVSTEAPPAPADPGPSAQ